MNMQRKLFEKWASGKGFIVEYDEVAGAYSHDHTDLMWFSWQAAIMENERINAKCDSDGLPPEPKP